MNPEVKITYCGNGYYLQAYLLDYTKVERVYLELEQAINAARSILETQKQAKLST